MEAAFASKLTSATSKRLSLPFLHPLERVDVSEKLFQTLKEKFKLIQNYVANVTNRSQPGADFDRRKKANALIFDLENYFDEHDLQLLRRKNRAFEKTSFDFRMHRKINKIDSLIHELMKLCDLSLEQKDLLIENSSSFSLIDSDDNVGDPEFFRMTSDAEKIIQMLLSGTNSRIAIVGMAGIGKTTVADRIFKNEMIQDYFRKHFWVPVGVLHERTIIRAMLQSLDKEMPNSSESDFEESLNRLLKVMKKERVLLVLDDVRSVNQGHFDNLLYHLQREGAKISVLVTTRRIENAMIIGADTCHLQGLSYDESWELFKLVAFRSKPIVNELETAGKLIVKKCHGVPLLIRKMASLLQNKENVSEWESIAKSELLDLPSFQTLSTLSLTYDRLPDSLKRCFVYCSIFPKHAVIRKSDLIRLWFAQDFLDGEPTQSSFETGENYFDILLNESLLQVYKQDEDGNVVECTMLELAHDLAMKFSRHEVLTIDDQINGSSHPSDVRHLVISSESKLTNSIRLRTCRTIYAMGAMPENTLHSMRAVLENLMSQARYLYVLKLDEIGLKEVPKNLGKLKFLRYLDLSNNPIKCVPESITHLYLLQTLLLRNCEKLLGVPKGLANLTNLLHFEISPQLSNQMVPPTALRRQPPINLDEESGSIKLFELGNLTDIAGPLCISGLEYVKDRKTAQEARIGRKYGLSALEFQWSRKRVEVGDSQHNQDESVLDGLQPHPKVQRLKLINYNSQQFPRWVMRMKVEDNVKLYRLVKIELVECKRCLKLPTMGQLPCLRELFIAGMDNIEIIGSELYKYADDNERIGIEVFFPALRRLILRNFSRLKNWLPAPNSERINTCRTFPCLETLQIVSCPKLASIPTAFPNMKNLLIQGIKGSNWLDTIIRSSCKNRTLTSLVLCRVSNLNLPGELFRCTSLEELSLQECQDFQPMWHSSWNLTSLKELCIDNCSQIIYPRDVSGLVALDTLVIRDGRFKRAPIGLQMCTSITKLSITNCSNLQTIPNLQQLTNLEELDILDCLQLECLPAGLQDLPTLKIMRVGAFHNFTNFPSSKSLEKLWLKGKQDLIDLPDQPKCLSQLKVLRIKSFASLETIPDWIRHLKELEILIFEECHKLRQFPPRDIMLQLKKLRSLRIEKCSILERSSHHWESIGHIPHIKFKGCWHQGDRTKLLQGNPDIKAQLSSIDAESEQAGYVIGGPDDANSDEKFYDVREKPNDSFLERIPFYFYFMAFYLLIVVLAYISY